MQSITKNEHDDLLDHQLKPRSPFQLALKRFLKNKVAIVGIVVLLLVLLAALFAPLLTDHDPTIGDLLIVEQPPSSEHILGTDASGRCVLSRLLYWALV